VVSLNLAHPVYERVHSVHLLVNIDIFMIIVC